jgi:O-antigen/teichoic acid export membrane protein
MFASLVARSPALSAAFRGGGNAATLLRGTAGSFGLKCFTSLTLLAAQVIFARLLGVEGFGIYIVALSWMSILLLFGRLGFDYVTVRFIAIYHGRADWVHLRGMVLASQLIVTAGAGGLALLFAAIVWLIRERIGAELAITLWIAAATAPVFAVAQIKAATLRGMGRVVLGDLPVSLIQPLMLLMGLPLLVLGLGFEATPALAFATYFAGTALALAVLTGLVRRVLPRAIHACQAAFSLREWLAVAPAMMLFAGFALLLHQINIILMSHLAGLNEAGIYGATTRVATILQTVLFSLVSAVAPMAARLHARGEKDELQRAVRLAVRIVFLATVAAALAILVAGRWILGFWGAEFVAGYPAMAILIIGHLFWAAAAPAGTILNMTGHQRISAQILIAAALLNLVLGALLIPRYGMVGAALATAIVMALWNGAMAFEVRRRLGFDAHFTITPVQPWRNR